MDNFNFKKYLAEGRLLKEDKTASRGEPLNDTALLNFLQQNVGEVVKEIGADPEDARNLKFEFDNDGDPSIVIDDITGYSFRRPENINHIGPVGMENIDDIENGLDKPFEGEEGDEPRPINVKGVDLIYIGYNQ
jgi:hypothetical protein